MDLWKHKPNQAKPTHKKNNDSMENLLAYTKGSKKSSSVEGGAAADKPTKEDIT